MLQLHLAALASLKGEILDLSSRLHTVTQERDLLEKTLNKTQVMNGYDCCQDVIRKTKT
jgi:hypothetical protein